MSEDSFAKANERLKHLRPGDTVAVITFQGSFCPVTVSHVQCVVEARELLLPSAGDAPQDLEVFADIIGFMGCNPDKGLIKKLDPLPIISIQDRAMLIGLATEEHDWLAFHSWPEKAVNKLRRLYRRLTFIIFELDGADAALWTKPWRRAKYEQRYIVMGRPADPGKDNGTDKLRREMEKNGIWENTAFCLVGPEMPVVSSTAVRKNLLSGNILGLRDLLHPAVQDWNLNEGPYAPGRADP